MNPIEENLLEFSMQALSKGGREVWRQRGRQEWREGGLLPHQEILELP